tara:strand:- start:5040 stop:5351 length:312 start_codon:yes stop_codon:yes gene_type:complete
MALFGPDNLKGVTTTGNGLGPQTRIFAVNKGTGDHTQGEVEELVKELTTGITKGTSDAVTVVGIAGTIGTDPIHIAVQGTGAVDTSGGGYVTDITLSLVATFN